MNFAEATRRLEELGVQHAPEQRYLGCEPGDLKTCSCPEGQCEQAGKVYGREVLTTTPPGLYYITSEDNGQVDQSPAIQLLAVNVPEQTHKLAEALGWRVREAPHMLPINPPTAPLTVLAAIIEPAV